VGSTVKAIPLQPILAADEWKQVGRKTRIHHGRTRLVTMMDKTA
jgi:hypothetical protein